MKSIVIALLIAMAVPAIANAEIKISARVQAFNLSGDPITEIATGGSFLLRAFVDDVRTSTPIQGPMGENLFGTFSAFMDVTFDAGKIGLSGPVEVADYFALTQIEQASPGMVRGGGGSRTVQFPGSDEQLLFTVPLIATGA